jgi:hypothetical protein
MKNRFLIPVATVSALMAASSILPAQAPPVRRVADGKPDLSGIWQTQTGSDWDILDHRGDYAAPAGKGIVEGNALNDPDAHCQLPGVPRAVYVSPWKIVQTPQEVTMLYEFVHGWRVIPLDNRKHPETLEPSWMGDSVGHWDGDTLVVDVAGFNDKTWFDMAGNFHSAAMHVVERYRPTDANTIAYEATIDDPMVFTKSWKMSFPIHRVMEPRFQLSEFECSDTDR